MSKVKWVIVFLILLLPLNTLVQTYRVWSDCEGIFVRGLNKDNYFSNGVCIREDK
jgi:hypothetical protein